MTLIVPLQGLAVGQVLVEEAWAGGNPVVRMVVDRRSDHAEDGPGVLLDSREARALAAALWHHADRQDEEPLRIPR